MTEGKNNFSSVPPPLEQRSPGVAPLIVDRQDRETTSNSLLENRQFRRRLVVFTIDLCLGTAIFTTYIVIGRAVAILPWLYTLVLLTALGTWWDRSSQQQGRLLQLLLTSYLVVSLIGAVDISDNLRHFGTVFGGGADDSEYFFNARTLLQDGVILPGTGLYDLVLAAWGFLPNLIWKETTTAFEFLPLNWALAAAVVGLCDELCYAVIKERPPIWILVTTLLGNYKFTDATIHLYRDGLLLTFFLLALNSVMRSQPARSLLYALPVLALRAANFGLYAFALLLSTVLGKSRKRAVFYGWVLSFLFIAATLFPTVGPLLFRYATRITFGGYSGGEYIAPSILQEGEFRGQVFAMLTGTAQSTTLGYVMANNGPASLVLRPITFELLPVRFWPLEMGADSESRFAVRPFSERALTLRNVYLWFCVLCWVVVVPLLIVGLGASAFGTRKLNILFVYYLLSVFAVSFVSFELRHATAFTILHPLLAMLGYNAIRKDKRVRLVALSVGVLTFVGICLYNSFAGPVL